MVGFFFFLMDDQEYQTLSEEKAWKGLPDI